MKPALTIATILMMALIAEPALAKKSKRRGFNFGASIQARGSGLVTNSSVETGNKINEKVETSSMNPHIGYVVTENLNIGLAMTKESVISESKETSATGDSDFYRKSEADLSGTSIFARFLFANYVYFEAGAGLYERSVKTTQTARTDIVRSSFVGSETVSNTKGIGTGYNYGIGLEFPIAKSGFFFTSSYNFRFYQLRDTGNDIEIGKKAGSSNSKELNFGLTHYLK